MSLHQPRVVPWRSTEELVLLKNDFYPDLDSGAPDRRAQALSKVQAWQVRTRVPHAIESTAQLTSALLLDIPATPVSPLHLRLGYSTAICRFVNGLLDPAQQSQFALPMHLLAKNLNLPASFVELRHAATHEALPSLVVLRTVAARALDWLWSDYWAAIGVETDERAAGGAEEEVLVARARAAVRAWRRLRRENPMREIKAGDSSVEGKETLAVVKECADVVLGGDEGAQAVITVLLEEKALIPAGKKKSKMMKGARLLWTPLLEKIEEAAPGFVARLLEAMGEVLRAAEELSTSLLREAREARPAAVLLAELEERDAEFTTAVMAWAGYLVGEKQTRSGKVAAGVDVEQVVKQSLLQPNEWSMQLLKIIMAEHPTLKAKYQSLVDLAAMHVQSGTGKKLKRGNTVEKRPLEAIEAEIDDFEERFTKIQQQKTRMSVVVVGETKKTGESAGRWRRWQGEWTPTALGVVV